MHKSHLQQVEDYVLSILTERTPIQNKYHSVAHTRDVVNSSIEIGIGEKLTPDEMEMVQIAAWFHDIGYIEKSEDHEEISAMYASNFLSEGNYPSDRIESIISCILATKVPQKPKNKLEEIICDSDLNHIGREIFFKRNDIFRLEYENHIGRKLTEYEWITKTIDFVTRHRFFTKYALKNFSEQKKENLRILQEQLDQIINQSK
ncbi:MAG: HD domain-containing protein [Melioribacteraceae bacterium]